MFRVDIIGKYNQKSDCWCLNDFAQFLHDRGELIFSSSCYIITSLKDGL